jgi:hypothetical protein
MNIDKAINLQIFDADHQFFRFDSLTIISEEEINETTMQVHGWMHH